MRTRTALVLAGAIVTLTLAFSVASASAGKLHLSSRTFRITWSALRFFPTGEAASIRCPVTLEGSFYSMSIRKVLSADIGLITRSITKTEACVGEGMPVAIIQEVALPFTVQYAGFTGTLPMIASMRVRLVDFKYSFFFFSVECLYGREGEALGGAFLRVGGGQVLTFEFDRTLRIKFESGGIVCPGSAGIEGVGQNFVLGSTSRWILELI